MRLKLPATNLSYTILSVKYVLDGEECNLNMHLLNDNKMEKIEIDVPDGAVVTTVTMNEVTDAQKVVSIQVLYDADEEEPKPEDKPEPTYSNLKVETQAKAKVERKEDHAKSHSERKTESESESGSQKEGQSKEKKEK